MSDIDAEIVPPITLAQALEAHLAEDSEVSGLEPVFERFIDVAGKKLRLSTTVNVEGTGEITINATLQSMPHSGQGSAFNVLLKRNGGQHNFLFIVSAIEKAKEESQKLAQALKAYIQWALKDAGSDKSICEDWADKLVEFIPSIKKQIAAQEAAAAAEPQEPVSEEQPQEAAVG